MLMEVDITAVFRDKIGEDVFVFDIMAIDKATLCQGTKIGCFMINAKNGKANYHGLISMVPDIGKLANDCGNIITFMKQNIFQNNT